MKLIETIKRKIALRKQRKAKLRQFADMMDFTEIKGGKYLDLSVDIVCRKSIQARGIGPHGPAFIWRNRDGDIEVDGNLIVWGKVREFVLDTDHKSISTECVDEGLEQDAGLT